MLSVASYLNWIKHGKFLLFAFRVKINWCHEWICHCYSRTSIFQRIEKKNNIFKCQDLVCAIPMPWLVPSNLVSLPGKCPTKDHFNLKKPLYRNRNDLKQMVISSNPRIVRTKLVDGVWHFIRTAQANLWRRLSFSLSKSVIKSEAVFSVALISCMALSLLVVSTG